MTHPATNDAPDDEVAAVIAVLTALASSAARCQPVRGDLPSYWRTGPRPQVHPGPDAWRWSARGSR